MIDLHLHLLPNVDDGAEDLVAAVAMIERAAALGYRTLVSTPHLDGALKPDYAARIAEALNEVQPAAEAAGIAVQRGFEIQLPADLPHRLEAGEALTLAGSDTVLVECPFIAWPLHADQTLFNVQTTGFRPLLAHPERYTAIQSEPAKASVLAERGVLLQVTVSSLAGVFGKQAQQVAEYLLSRDEVTVLATDAHSAGRRYELVESGLARAEELIGPARLHQLTTDNPEALLASDRLPHAAPIEPRPRSGGWRSLFKR